MNRKSEIFETAGIGLIAVAVWAVLIILSDVNLSEIHAIFFKGILENLDGFTEVFVEVAPLIFTSLGHTVAFRTGFFSIDTEGQPYIGTPASARAALTWTRIPDMLRILCAILIEFVFGGLWALMAAMSKAKLRISEITVTIVLSYIAISLLDIVVRTSLMDPAGGIPQSSKLDPSVTLYRLLKPIRPHAGFIIAVLAMFLIWFIPERTTVGYEIKVVGFNERVAACNGISVVRNIIISASLSGGLAGVAGTVEVMGMQGKPLEGISWECGYTAVLIVPLVSNHPPDILFTAITFAALGVEANSMQGQMRVPLTIVNILVGLTVPLILGRELFCRERKREKPC